MSPESPPPHPPALPGSGPVALADRIPSLDVMRGFAVCGILVINIQAFALLEANYEHAVFNGAAEGINYWVWLFGFLVFHGKAISIFSILFGAGIVLSTRRRDAVGLPGAAQFYRRYGILAGVGILHAYFLWFGDILLPYAICAFLAYLFRNCRIRTLVILGILCRLVYPAVLLLVHLGMAALPEMRAEMELYWTPSPEQVEAEIGAVRGPWSSWFLRNAGLAVEIQLGGIPFMLLWVSGGLMLLGMALLRSGFFELQWRTSTYLAGAVAGILAGLVCNGSAVAVHHATDWSVDYAMLAAIPNEFGAPFSAYGTLCVGMLIVRAGAFSFFTGILANLGRMALTNYLLQSLICALLFDGWGLGLFQQLDRVQMLGVVIGILLFEAIFSTLWLSRFRLGPLEWFWRRLSYRSAKWGRG